MIVEKQEWTKEGYQEFLEYLYSFREDEFQQFHQKLVPGEDNILGIRIPKLREIAKKILKGDSLGYLRVAGDGSNEEKILMGLVIGGLKEKEVPFEQIMQYIEGFIPKITNWSVCDCFCSSLKVTQKHKEEIFAFLDKYQKSQKEYEARFAYVMYLNYYMSKEYLTDIFHYCDQCTNEYYYVQMAIAWMISNAYIKERDMTDAYLYNNCLSDVVYNKALQKIIESNRVTKEEKEEIKKRKRR